MAYSVLISLICDGCKETVITRDYIALNGAMKGKGWQWERFSKSDLRLFCPKCKKTVKPKPKKEAKPDSALMKAFDILLPEDE